MAQLSTILRRARELALQIARLPPEPITEASFANVIFNDHELGTCCLSFATSTTYHDILAQLTKCLEDRMSKQAISKLLQKAILRTADRNNLDSETAIEDRTEKAFRELQESLQETPRLYVTFYPLGGIEPPFEPWALGDVVITGENGWWTKTRQMITTHPSQELHAKTMLPLGDGELGKRLEKSLSGRAVAAVYSRALEAGGAREAASRHLRFVLDCLNFFSDLVHAPGMKCEIFEHETRAIEPRHRITLEKAENRCTLFSERTGPVRKLTVDDFQSDWASGFGVDRVTDILRSKCPTSFQRRLIGSIQWAGRATGEPRKEQAFLLCAIALESLLMGSIEHELAYRLRVRVGHLLFGAYEDRQRIFKRLKELYKVRSAVVHGGAYEVSDDDLRDIRAIAKSTIGAVLRRPEFQAMKTKEELDEWFDRTLIGGE